MNLFYTSRRQEWRDWLAAHFETEKDVWFVFPMKGAGEAGLCYNDAVEEALCFGWIDSTIKHIDPLHRAQRFTPRNPKSSYSQPNIERLKWLDARGLIHPKIRPSLKELIEAEFVFPADILAAIRQDETAWEYYAAFPEPYRRIRVAYIDAARDRPAEFEKRLLYFIRKTRENKRIVGYGGIDKYYGDGTESRRKEERTMKYPLSEKYDTPELMAKIMGPNPLKLEEELLTGHQIPAGALVCDLGSGQGLTSVFLVKEYGFKVYAADLWSDPEENRRFFAEMGLTDAQITPVKADAMDLPFEKEFFDAVVSTDSYNYFGRDPEYLDAKLLPFVKKGGLIYVTVPGMKKDCHDALPPELLLSWTPEQLDYLHDAAYWTDIVSRCRGAEVLTVSEMESNEEVWADWLRQENEYAVGDRKAMEAGGGKYLNFIKIVLRKK